MTGEWKATWISFTQHPEGETGVFAFRRLFNVSGSARPGAMRISADQRYQLYVNGAWVGEGPQRGDLLNWHFETYDVAPFLREGNNWIVAIVWNFGRYAPMAQHAARLGLVVEMDGASTPDGWEVAKVPGWGFDMLHSQVGPFYIDVGPGEVMDARTLGWGCHEGGDGGLKWSKPNEVCPAFDRGGGGGGTPWMLVPRTLPPMERRARKSQPIVRTGNAATVDKRAPLLLDYEELITAYPRIKFCGPKGTKVTLTYAEAFFDKKGNKENRNDIAGKKMWGYQDKIVLDGEERTFAPLWWRTYRYLRIESSAPVDVKGVEAIETGYPYQVDSSFSGECTKAIWDVAVRTLKRCAGETYFDCPYYEQLQYVGDTRIQALAGYYLSTDRALQRNAIDQIAQSTMPDGLTQSRYPSRQVQVIPPFSLWWIMMLYDQWLYDRRPIPPRHIEIAQGVLHAWDRLNEGNQEHTYWSFADWVPSWRWGEPPGKARSSIHLFTKLMAEAALAKITGDDARVEKLRGELSKVERHEDGLAYHSLDPAKFPSEHAAALHRLCQQLLDQCPDAWPDKALVNAAKCTTYFAYYKHLAKHPADYLAELGPWHEMIGNGLTTFAESLEPTRSDCHAWSAHPVLGLLQIVAGVTSIAPGWRRARIEPRPGRLRTFTAHIAHPDGPLVVKLVDGHLTIESPVDFELHWKDDVQDLAAGSHHF